MKDIFELQERLDTLASGIRECVKWSGFGEYNDLSELKCDNNDPDQLMLRSELTGIMDTLDNAAHTLAYLRRPIQGEYVLHKDSDGHYACQVRTFTSGTPIEALVYDDNNERWEWMLTRIEHNGAEYYLVGKSKAYLEGLKVRIR